MNKEGTDLVIKAIHIFVYVGVPEGAACEYVGKALERIPQMTTKERDRIIQMYKDVK